MKLEQLILKNFRAYKSKTVLDVDDLTALIGRNDAGKSSILEALEIFFNNSLVTCEREDLSVGADSNKIEITCVFGDVRDQVVIDTDNPTTLSDEHLLNSDGKLEIKKVFAATAAKPKPKIYIHCLHPSSDECKDLLELKRTDLRQRAKDLGVPEDSYNSNINASIRQAIRSHIGELDMAETDLLVDKEDTKKVYESIRLYLPVYALFQSDRASRDDDREVTDPMKLAVQQALQGLEQELQHIKDEVRAKAVETADRTLEKLKEMAPDLAQELSPDFKVDPKFDSQFKLSISSEEGIPVNKRGSGVRRLILLNFFRAEAERQLEESTTSKVIYAFEEPETSQHPDHQELLVKAFLQLSATNNAQILLTTHTPALAGLIPVESVRFIDVTDSGRRIQRGTTEVLKKVVETLGVLPDPIPTNTAALLLLEGKGDITFVEHAARRLHEGGFIESTFEEKRIALVLTGGCDNLKHWITRRLADQFGIPYCVLLDSDLGTQSEAKQRRTIEYLHAEGIKAYVTRKREPENYINPACLGLEDERNVSFSEHDDAKLIISDATGVRRNNVLDRFWPAMSCDQIREAERYIDDNGIERYEFTEMFSDFFSLVD